MTTRMLIDARHREETRVAVVKGNRIEEFDFESAERKQLKGNIYLAKVTRVEPSLQAAFVDYGGNRHGFLAFSEIHPDYYQIPKEDREALLREEAEHAEEEERLRAREDAEDEAAEAASGEGDSDLGEDSDEAPPAESVDGSGGASHDDAVESLRERRMRLRRRYKIQDVIRRRQVLLVQVVKEERGNKGAALTTYLSLAGRYCVLMPNTAQGGGISRKISNAADRKRLKSIMAELKLPKTMGCIVRTAGLSRTKTEIKRDFDYLARLWDTIRENTLSASAPALIYGDSDLIKRAIRDIYNRDIDEVIVEGEEGYRASRSFMKLLMPSHVRRIQGYADPVPLFQRFGVEDQLSQMYQPVVQLKSGGYLVINPTEALVSIDINSGRSTREHGIEQTAVATNLEAAQEIARQLRLRDMAGLVVIDFIDMENGSNVRKVEKAMKAALANDRARIQVGRISSFGLMEMSRQRLRTGVLEASTRPCPHCEGSGFVRTASSAGLSALRLLEDEAARGRGSQLLLRASQEAAFYVLNHKRAELAEIEDRYGVRIEVAHSGEIEGARMAVEASGPPPAHAPRFEPPQIEFDEDEPIVEDEDEEVEERAERPERAEREDRAEGEGGGRRRRRRRRGKRDRDRDEGAEPQASEAEASEPEAEAIDAEDSVEEPGTAEAAEQREDSESRRRRGRRGRRGGRRRHGGEERVAAEAGLSEAEPVADDTMGEAEPAAEPEPVAEAVPEAAAEEAPKRRRTRRKAEVPAEAAAAAEAPADDARAEAPAPEPEAKPKRTRRTKAAAAEAEPVEQPASEAEAEAEAEAKPKRTRRKKAETAPVAEAPAPQPVAIEAAPAAETAPAAREPAEPANDQPARKGWWQRTITGKF
ncbi:Rne/Rng family ribonuclease [Sphingomonas sp. MAH-20]|uniref:Ribonuclease E n=1 Tax=Sphingomonas horti TaxID=2682842 RepID=A0A6I4J5A5_9SPHN|nr:MULTISPECIES: ribonuclease E/G [Sphingomonas]MBA2919270.1 ribonuclease E/G [Sphingomonas sp. CGMCC 1.13658]MVO79303.1 Rne/Rng family ribonuclease [Sphingomonas horti]